MFCSGCWRQVWIECKGLGCVQGEGAGGGESVGISEISGDGIV